MVQTSEQAELVRNVETLRESARNATTTIRTSAEQQARNAISAHDALVDAAQGDEYTAAYDARVVAEITAEITAAKSAIDAAVLVTGKTAEEITGNAPGLMG